MTVVTHDSENRTHVNGFEAGGDCSRDIQYIGSSLTQIKSLTNVSSFCQQFIKHEYKHSVLSLTKYAWWVSRDREKMA